MELRNADDYFRQLEALLPPGPAWELQRQPELAAALRGLAPEFARVEGVAAELLREMMVATMRLAVADWEEVMGLPDPCLAGGETSFEDRRIAVQRRLVEVGNQRPAYFEELARSQGYPAAKVVQHRAPRFGRARCGRGRFGTWAQQFMWTLYTGPRRRQGRRFGVTCFGERFGANPASALDCRVRRAAPPWGLESIKYEEAPN